MRRGTRDIRARSGRDLPADRMLRRAPAADRPGAQGGHQRTRDRRIGAPSVGIALERPDCRRREHPAAGGHDVGHRAGGPVTWCVA